MKNRLSNEKSPYLRHAAEQPIDWYPWSDEPFLRAEREGKAVFLSSGGVWCHWCHVMAKESFENAEVATLLNELFISVKLDRDERPDIDRRYQQAVALMGGGGGWPLSVFLTPDRRPFFGGTYFPPDDRYGRPGFIKVLISVHEFYQSRKGEAVEYGVRIMDALKAEVLEAGDLTRDSLEQAKIAMLGHFDAQHGGFGASPKFPMPGALEFLLHQAATRKDRHAENAVRTTLDAMARGGFHDHLAGGFHRYSVDEAWFVPHFEKMADDNAWLLRNYIDAYALFGEERYKEIALGIIRFVRDVLSDPAGGFYASQDADVTPDDEGGYFTWTDEDFKRVLTIEEYEVLSLRFFHERGALPHDQAKKVLCSARELREIAGTVGMSEEAVATIIARGREKLLLERNGRETPFVDRTLYTSLNGMFITSFLKAYRVLGDAGLRDFALTSLDRVLKERFIGGALYHTEGVPAVLDDHIYIIEALVAAYEATGDPARLDAAAVFMDRCLEQFGDGEGGFFDTGEEVLGARLKRVEDIPHPSANATAALLLIKLFHCTGTESYRSQAERVLRIFSVTVNEMSIHAGTYYCALDAWFTMLKLTVEAAPTSDLAVAARRLTGPYTVVVYGEDKGRIVPCIGETCYAPVTNNEELVRLATRLVSP
jgi:uncharacterized protein YyaL (SSP411 family)